MPPREGKKITAKQDITYGRGSVNFHMCASVWMSWERTLALLRNIVFSIRGTGSDASLSNLHLKKKIKKKQPLKPFKHYIFKFYSNYLLH